MGERYMDNMLPGETTAGQNYTEGIRRKSYSKLVIKRVTRGASMFVGDSIVRKNNRFYFSARRD